MGYQDHLSADAAQPILAQTENFAALQATFSFSMTAPAGQKVLFNMPESGSGTPVDGGMVAHTFQDTPIMSTYLVAFIVGNLTAVETTVPATFGMPSARPVQVWGTPERCLPCCCALAVDTR